MNSMIDLDIFLYNIICIDLILFDFISESFLYMEARDKQFGNIFVFSFKYYQFINYDLYTFSNRYIYYKEPFRAYKITKQLNMNK